ncbi:hypothetical protein PHMEG_00010840 [Phytophthora megakarya]|uniref:Uncharacterized protein n=1 Tax=Phytophthora megakarya TaxID=4795 RepID=A0A225WE30_9STRA|nr:hypothetical protein PHMEG_00010840 [Phytophthora megakarya]
MVIFVIAYVMPILFWLVILSKHGSETQELKLHTGTSTIQGVGLLLHGTNIPFVLAVHALSVREFIQEPTSCLGFSSVHHQYGMRRAIMITVGQDNPYSIVEHCSLNKG